MRLLHTSDWHLGRSLHRADLREAQATFIDHLVEVVRRERIDTVLVAGDVYDRAIPPVEAVELFQHGLGRLRDAGARVVLISGNHDSARRLGVNAGLIDAAGVHLRTRVGGIAEPVLLGDEHGQVAVYAIPYLEPAAVGGELPGPPGEAREHAEVLGRACAAARADLATRATTRSVAIAHAWVHGGAGSDSERDITVGGAAAVPAREFEAFTYTALGHLHGPQTLAANLRYSGSPLPYSFSEAGHTKGSWLVELDAAGLGRVEHIPAPVHRRLSVLRGTLDDLLTDPGHERCRGDFLSVTLTDTARPEAAMDRLRARFDHVLLLTHEPEGATDDGRGYRARVRGRPDDEVAAEFVGHVRGTAPGPAETVLLSDAFEAVRRREVDPAAGAAADAATGASAGAAADAATGAA